MTREEAIKRMKQQKIEYLEKWVDYGGVVEAYDMAIKVLEQEPILDKIRAEIIELRSRQNVGVLECLDIIDKYKAESEDKEIEGR